jgi:hypothetical protein
MAPGLLPWLALGGLGLLLAAAAGIAAFRLALSRATTPEARSAAIRSFAVSALLFALFAAWAGRTAADLAALLHDPERDRHAVADLLIERIYCALWLSL